MIESIPKKKRKKRAKKNLNGVLVKESKEQKLERKKQLAKIHLDEFYASMSQSVNTLIKFQ